MSGGKKYGTGEISGQVTKKNTRRKNGEYCLSNHHAARPYCIGDEVPVFKFIAFFGELHACGMKSRERSDIIRHFFKSCS